MATTDWDHDLTLAIQAKWGSLPDIIRAYDEPDTNLHNHAQRQLFKSISEISTHERSNIHSIISTHSPRVIDRAPAKSIRMLSERDGVTVSGRSRHKVQKHIRSGFHVGDASLTYYLCTHFQRMLNE